MVELNSEIGSKTTSRLRGFIAALALLAGFELLYCVGYYSGIALESRQDSISGTTKLNR